MSQENVDTIARLYDEFSPGGRVTTRRCAASIQALRSQTTSCRDGGNVPRVRRSAQGARSVETFRDLHWVPIRLVRPSKRGLSE